MKNCLLFLAVVAALMFGAPAYSQYLYFDCNGGANPRDGLSSLNPANAGMGLADDVLVPGQQNVDVYFVTDKNRTGLGAVCAEGLAPMMFNAYQFVVRSSGNGTVTYNSWMDAMNFPTGIVLPPGGGTTDFYTAAGGSDAWIGKTSSSFLPAGKFKVGTLNITVTDTPKLDFAISSSLSTSAMTAFGSDCVLPPGFDGFVRLGSHFTDTDGTMATTPVVPTTWGKIKKLYQNQ